MNIFKLLSSNHTMIYHAFEPPDRPISESAVSSETKILQYMLNNKTVKQILHYYHYDNWKNSAMISVYALNDSLSCPSKSCGNHFRVCSTIFE